MKEYDYYANSDEASLIISLNNAAVLGWEVINISYRGDCVLWVAWVVRNKFKNYENVETI